MRSAPHIRLFAAISLIKLIVSSVSFGFLELALDLCFGEHLEKLPMEAAAASLAGQGRALVSRHEPCWPGTPGEVGLSFCTRVA
jgi:hypothetical protein